MLKPIMIMYPVIPARDEEERAALRPIGRHRERYQDAIRGMTEIIQAADEMGFWGAATPEHHFWSEGYEVAPSPGATNAWWLAKTKNIRIGPLGYVMSTHNPIRVAEEVAVIDHLSKGRTFVGFARGYQSRWTNTLGQHFGTRATKSPDAAVYNAQTVLAGFSQETQLQRDKEDDAHNRRIFEDNIELVLKAWTQESFTHKGPAWQVPYPYEAGIEDWPLARAGVTQKLGAPGEVDEAGVWRRASVAPAPYTQPHPKVFVAGSGSPETIEFCGRHGFVPTYFASIAAAGPLSERYRTRCRAARTQLRAGAEPVPGALDPDRQDRGGCAGEDPRLRSRHLEELLCRDGPAQGRGQRHLRFAGEFRAVRVRHGGQRAPAACRAVEGAAGRAYRAGQSLRADAEGCGDRDDRYLPAPDQAGAGRGDRQFVPRCGGVRG